MTFKISGFGGTQEDAKPAQARNHPEQTIVPRKSIVQVQFPGRGKPLSYYNDQFDLKVGDLVWVDGKLENLLGRVTDITYNFKIKLSEYQEVIAVADTEIHGAFFLAGSHFVTFDPSALPAEQVSLWFKAPAQDEEDYVSGNDDSSFSLEDLSGMQITNAIADRGHDYYIENKVRYLCLDGGRGYAIVEGTKSYTVEFEYDDREIRNLVCDCPCGYPCKHEFAAMLQLKETLDLIELYYGEEFARSDYFAALFKGTFFSFAIDTRQTGSFTI